MNIWIHTMLAVVSVGAASLVGAAFLGKRRDRLDTLLMYLVSLSAGVLVGGAVLHLLPRAFSEMPGTLEAPLYFLAGFLGFFFLERYLWRLHHDHSDFPLAADAAHDHGPEPLAAMAVVGGGFHNFIDGAMIAAAFTLDVQLGWITTGAVLLHEIPRELGDFGILVHAGLDADAGSLVQRSLGPGGSSGGGVDSDPGLPHRGNRRRAGGHHGRQLRLYRRSQSDPGNPPSPPEIESIGHALVLLGGVAIMLLLALAEPWLSAG